MSTDRFSAYVGEDIAWNSDVWRDIGDMTREPASAKEAGPAVVGDPQGSPASTEGERPDSGSSPHGQRAMEYTATEERGPHGRTGSRDGLPEDLGPRFGASQDQGAERLSGLDNVSGREATQGPGENHGSRGAPGEGAVHMADADGAVSPSERESGAHAPIRKEKKGVRRRNTANLFYPA